MYIVWQKMQQNVYGLQPNVYTNVTQCVYPMYIEYTLGDMCIYIGQHLTWRSMYIVWHEMQHNV